MSVFAPLLFLMTLHTRGITCLPENSTSTKYEINHFVTVSVGQQEVPGKNFTEVRQDLTGKRLVNLSELNDIPLVSKGKKVKYILIKKSETDSAPRNYVVVDSRKARDVAYWLSSTNHTVTPIQAATSKESSVLSRVAKILSDLSSATFDLPVAPMLSDLSKLWDAIGESFESKREKRAAPSEAGTPEDRAVSPRIFFGVQPFGFLLQALRDPVILFLLFWLNLWIVISGFFSSIGNFLLSPFGITSTVSGPISATASSSQAAINILPGISIGAVFGSDSQSPSSSFSESSGDSSNPASSSITFLKPEIVAAEIDQSPIILSSPPAPPDASALITFDPIFATVEDTPDPIDENLWEIIKNLTSVLEEITTPMPSATSTLPLPSSPGASEGIGPGISWVDGESPPTATIAPSYPILHACLTLGGDVRACVAQAQIYGQLLDGYGTITKPGQVITLPPDKEGELVPFPGLFEIVGSRPTETTSKGPLLPSFIEHLHPHGQVVRNPWRNIGR